MKRILWAAATVTVMSSSLLALAADKQPAANLKDVEPEDTAATLAALAEEAEEAEKVAAKETKAGKMVTNRNMARALLEYGMDTENPEAIILAIQILHRNPVTAVKEDKEAHNAEIEERIELIGAAVELRPDDEGLLIMAERVAGELEESTRGLAGGPKSWTVTIPKGKYYQLDPRLVYNAQEAAIITAYPADPAAAGKVMLGGSVRRYDQRTILRKTVGKGKVVVNWNSGIYTTGWDCRIYNLNGPDDLVVKIETN